MCERIKGNPSDGERDGKRHSKCYIQQSVVRFDWFQLITRYDLIPCLFFPSSPSFADQQQHHELLAPASVRQQLCSQFAQWLHDGLAEAIGLQRFQQLHQLPSVPGHGEASAAARSASPVSASSTCLHRHVPQLFLQCGEDGSDRQRRAGQSCRARGKQRRSSRCSSGQTCSPQAQSAVSHR